MYRIITAVVTLTTLSALNVSSAQGQFSDKHAVVIATPSLEHLQELGKLLPHEAEHQIREMIEQFAGPLASLQSTNSPFGLWLDWKQETPNFGLFLTNDHRTELLRVLDKYNLTTIDLGDGLFEIKSGNPIYFREHGHWLLLSGDRSELAEAFDPTPYIQAAKNQALRLHVVNAKIPASARTAIAQVAATRLLPTSLDGPDEVSSERLIHWYGQRILDQLLDQADSLQITFAVDQGHLNMDVEAAGKKLSQGMREPANSHLPLQANEENSARFHLTLMDEEVAFLNWWSASLADQVLQGTDQVEIEDRKGVNALTSGARVISQLIRKSVQSGQIEGYIQKVGKQEDESTPLIGLRIKEGNWFADELRKWAESSDAKNLNLRGTEWNMDEIHGVKIHRFNFVDENDELTTVIVGLAPDVLYLSSGNIGLDQLRRVLDDSEQANPQKNESTRPLSFFLPEVGLERFFGWNSAQKVTSPLTGVRLTSEYTEKGLRYHFSFGHAQTADQGEQR